MKCDTCKFDPKNGGDGWSACDACIHNSCMKDGYEPMTNADRIRAMTDEELECFLGQHSLCARIEWCPDHGKCNKCVLDWLQQPCGGAEN